MGAIRRPSTTGSVASGPGAATTWSSLGVLETGTSAGPDAAGTTVVGAPTPASSEPTGAGMLQSHVAHTRQ